VIVVRTTSGTARTATLTARRRPLINICDLPPAVQRPDWDDLAMLDEVREELRELPGLVSAAEVATLRSLLARAAAGEVLVLQAGDCAEDPAECTRRHISRKAALVDVLADVLVMRTGRPVLRVGRIAGQYGKPRSRPTERVGGRDLPVYRGHMVNGPEPDAQLRRADPKRLLAGYWAASTAVDAVRTRNGDGAADRALWTSHEALLLDYEVPMVRPTHDGFLLSSTHWPWIGERTRQVDGAHVAVLAAVTNPVACKVGPRATEEEVLQLCARLDPRREPGRLTLIARMGADTVAGRVPSLVRAVRAAGHPVIWLCDPMHGNTVALPSGHKTRFVETVALETQRFAAAVSAAGGVAGGLHLEITPDEVTECVRDERDVLEAAGGTYTSLCDPRLNVAHAVSVVSAWPEQGGVTRGRVRR
jgi:3-deoxy-7-phosphoheptulonate synthase